MLAFVLVLIAGMPPALAQDTPAENRYTTGDQYLAVKTVRFDLDARTATLDVRWDASWRDAETWDAAWIVLKGRSSDGPLVPLQIREEPTVMDNRSSDGAEAAIRVPDDRVGVFVHRAAQGEGDNRWRLRVTWQGPLAVEAVEAFGVEMVRVPTGSFELGTTRSLTDRRNANTRNWLRGTSPAPLSALFQVDPDGEDLYGGTYAVTSDAPISIGTEAGDLYYLDPQFLDDFTSGDQQGPLPAAFPKGYRGFYQMKYEVTEQQYVDFLNALPLEQARRRWSPDAGRDGDPPPSTYRHTITREDEGYRTRRPHRAAVYLSWHDALAWADWMGLRPMTGLEFEKSARGPEPARFREFAWGVNELDAPNAFRVDRRILDPDGELASTENGDERVDGNVHLNMNPSKGAGVLGGPCAPDGFYNPNDPTCRSFAGGDGGWGPLRVGVHGVASGGSRVEAGAGDYGAMDLAGNALELVVTIGHPQGRAFRGTHGDGRLTARARATNPDWHADAETHYYAARGTNWSGHPNHARIADRVSGLLRGGARRSPVVGFRAVRTVE